MSSYTYIVAIDGSPGSERALLSAMEIAKQSDASLVLAHIIEWSPFSFHTPDELANRSKYKAEEVNQAKTAIISPVENKVKTTGIEHKTIVRHGHPVETLITVAKEEGANHIFIGKKGQSRIGALFGSVAGSLIQISDIAVTVVP